MFEAIKQFFRQTFNKPVHESNSLIVTEPKHVEVKTGTIVIPTKKELVIKNHKLEGVKYLPDPDYGETMNPKIILVHFTCSYNMPNTVEWFQNNAVDIHLLIDKNGEIVQMVPFNKTAAHAGKSSWNGYYGLNNFSIGIEVINIGPLTAKGDKFYNCYGKEWKGNVIKMPMLGYDYWEPFTEPQIDTLRRVIRKLMSEYQIPISMVAGHHEASPGRKEDPGGSLGMTMDEFRKTI